LIAAVIPVKALAEAKSRLAPHMAPAERAELMTALLARTVRVLRACGAIEAIALATPEVALAMDLGLPVVPDPGSLNGALRNGVRWAMNAGASRLLILPADLPSLEVADVEHLLAAAGATASIVIAPTLDGGTGALLLSPPDAISPAYGQHSFERHIRLAREAGVPVVTVDRPGFLRDLDTIDDLRDAYPTLGGGARFSQIVD
jgi:2-phospho-L-lactate/phosphoenolpyruvate guanylyltransferase